MSKPLISIVVPVYNVERYLKKCIESLLNQSYKEIEIILVDDGSLDNSSKICDEFSNNDKRVKVIHKENGGLSDARNVGIESARGQYITFVDSDDFVAYDYIEYLYNMLDKYKSDMSICNLARINENQLIRNDNNGKIYLKNVEQTFEMLLYADVVDVSACGKLFKTKVFEDIKFPIGKAYEDTAIMYKLISKCEKISIGTLKKYFYIRRKGSISNQKFNQKEFDYLHFTDEMLKYLYINYSSLFEGIKRYYFYSRIRLLRILCEDSNKNIEFTEKIVNEINLVSKDIMKNRKVPVRDKFAIISLKFGLPFFKISWFFYKKITKRD